MEQEGLRNHNPNPNTQDNKVQANIIRDRFSMETVPKKKKTADKPHRTGEGTPTCASPFANSPRKDSGRRPNVRATSASMALDHSDCIPLRANSARLCRRSGDDAGADDDTAATAVAFPGEEEEEEEDAVLPPLAPAPALLLPSPLAPTASTKASAPPPWRASAAQSAFVLTLADARLLPSGCGDARIGTNGGRRDEEDTSRIKKVPASLLEKRTGIT